MNNFPILSTILLAPIIAAIIAIFIPKEEGKTIKIVAAVGTLVSLALTVYAYFNYDHAAAGMQFMESVNWTKDLGITYLLGVDGISLPMLLLTSLIGFSAVYASWNNERRPKEFFILLLILIAGVMGTFVALDMFIFFLFYEVVVIPIYIMVIIWGSTKRVTKEYSGMKLTIYLLIGSAFLLVGMISLFVKTGGTTFSIPQLAVLANGPAGLSKNWQIAIFGLMGFGFTSLLSMFPFHSWSPDGYAGAPTAVSMIHAGVLKKIGGYGLIRIGLLILPLGVKFWAPTIAALAVANVAYAAMIALAQKDLKYVVGYSSVSHMGYVLIGFAALNSAGVNGAIANMFGHGVMSALFFAMIGNLYEKSHTRNIPDFGGIAHQLPRLSIGFMLAGMASLGLPGLVSFIPEFTIFIGAYDKYPALALIAIAGIIITALYILRTLANVLFGPRREEWDKLSDLKGAEMIPLVVLGFALVFFGMFPGFLMNLINTGVEPLLAHFDKIIALGGKF